MMGIIYTFIATYSLYGIYGGYDAITNIAPYYVPDIVEYGHIIIVANATINIIIGAWAGRRALRYFKFIK